MRIALCQFNAVCADPPGNVEGILAMARRAASQGAELALFPEAALPGYLPLDWIFHEAFLDVLGEAEARLVEEAPEGLTLVVGSLSRSGAESSVGKPLRNDALVLRDGRIVTRVAKRWLPEYDVFDEARYFGPGSSEAVGTFECAGQRIGITICEDIWGEQASGLDRPVYAGDPPMDRVHQGADVVLNLSASPYAQGRPGYREGLVSRLARRLDRPVFLCNLVGGNDDLIFDGHSVATDRQGKVICRALGFDEDCVVVDSKAPATLEAAPHAVVREGGPHAVSTDPALWEETFQALVLGTRDYLRKSGLQRVVLGLSGGIDSALVAVIAKEALGAQKVTAVAMPSEFSAAISEDDAEVLARQLGIEFCTLPIRLAHKALRAGLEPILGQAPRGLTDENLQPRIRGTYLMALANERRGIVLATGNKSEIAMGYCTLYGDMCGGLAPIADLLKTSVFALARHLHETRGGLIPLRTIERPPSAELRPDQKDTDSLPEYEVLDAILDAALVRRRRPEEIAAEGHEPRVVRDVLRRVRLNEHKRRQLAPALRISAKAFGRGRRFPLAAGDPWLAAFDKTTDKE